MILKFSSQNSKSTSAQASLFVAAALLASSVFSSNVANAVQPSSDVIPATRGPIRITAKFHASTQIEYGGKVIVVDPVGYASWTKKADIILITHPHGDHLDLPTIAKLKKPNSGTTVYAPDSLVDQINTVPGVVVQKMAPGQYGEIEASKGFPNIGLHAVRMYNLERGPRPGQKFHPKISQWNGYYLTLGGKRIYFAGDTEAIPEISNLKNIYAAFLPMNLPYTMTPQEAAKAARSFRPRVVYPYHFRSPFNKDLGNERTFARLMRGSGIRVKQLNWYPAKAVKKAVEKGTSQNSKS